MFSFNWFKNKQNNLIETEQCFPNIWNRDRTIFPNSVLRDREGRGSALGESQIAKSWLD